MGSGGGSGFKRGGCITANPSNRRKKRTAADVAKHWGVGMPAWGSNINTDGKNLYSYDLLIGFTGSDGGKFVYDYTAKGVFDTSTTSKHVNAAKKGWYFSESRW